MKKFFALLLMAGLTASASASLVHRYDFDTDASDSVGTADGTIYGSALIQDGGLYSGGSGISGQLDNGIPRNGALIDASAVDGITGAFTIECWVNAGQGGPWTTAFSFSDGTTGNYVIGTPARGNFGYASSVAVIGGGAATTEALAFGKYIDTGILVQMVASFDGTNLTYYQNTSTDFEGFNSGNSLSATIDATGLDLSSLTQIGVNGGGPWPDNSMNGTVYDFRIYDGAVSASQVEALYALGTDASNEAIVAAVPEPTTMALLGLGGLMLRRRK